jgi:aryl-alcohol dehydrogenase
MLNSVRATRMTGTIGFVGVQQGTFALESTDYIGKTIINILEGSADPQEFIPVMIELWQAGRFPFDRLIEQFPLEQINEAEQSSLAGGVIKPVLRP